MPEDRRVCCWACEGTDFPATADNWLTRTYMILCPSCGNKRCPHASDHRLACTGSNEPGQPGSIYTVDHGDAEDLRRLVEELASGDNTTPLSKEDIAILSGLLENS